MIKNRSFTDLPYKDFKSWFSALTLFADHCNDESELPKLELSLRSGHVIRGSIVSLHEDSGEQTLTILGLLDPYTKKEITIVKGNDVIALTLLEPEAYLTLLKGEVDHKIIDVTELKRAAKKIEIELEKVLQYPMTVEVATTADKDRWDILRTAGFLPSIFTQIASGESGKRKVRQNIKKIHITTSASNKTLLDQGILTLEVKGPLAIPVPNEKERLKKEIEAVL